MLYIRTGYNITIYFWPEVSEKKNAKMPPHTVSGGISRDRLKGGSPSFTRLSGGNRPHKSAGCDITSCFRSATKCN